MHSDCLILILTQSNQLYLKKPAIRKGKSWLISIDKARDKLKSDLAKPDFSEIEKRPSLRLS
jgi:hypothetical protein